MAKQKTISQEELIELLARKHFKKNETKNYEPKRNSKNIR